MADATKTIDIIVNTQQAVKSVDTLNKSMDENQKETKETTEEGKKYEKQLDSNAEASKGLFNAVDKMTGGLLSAVKANALMIKGLKGFKIALAATGIGAIVVAIGALVTMFKNGEEGQNRWNKIMRIAGTVFDNLKDVISDLGGVIFEAIVNPIETAKKAWEGIKEFFTDPIGTVKAGYEAATEAVKDFVKEIKEEVEIGSQLADLEAATDKKERKFWVEKAKREALIAELRRKSRDEENFAAEEREQFNREAIALIEENGRKESEIAAARLKLVADSNKLSESTKESLDEEAQLRTELFNIQTRNINLVRRLQTEGLTISRQANTELEKERDTQTEILDIEIKRLELKSQITKESEKAKLKSIEVSKVEVKGIEGATDANKGLTESQKKQIGALDAVNTVVGNLFKDNKAASIATTIINGITAGIKTFAQLGYPWGIPAAAAMAATTAVAVGKINKQQFALGGLLDGPNHSNGGIWVNAEGGEGIINKRSMSIPWVRDLASELNQIGGGKKFADGGIVGPAQTAQELQFSRALQQFEKQRTVLYREDVKTLDNQIESIEYRSTL